MCCSVPLEILYQKKKLELLKKKCVKKVNFLGEGVVLVTEKTLAHLLIFDELLMKLTASYGPDLLLGA